MRFREAGKIGEEFGCVQTDAYINADVWLLADGASAGRFFLVRARVVHCLFDRQLCPSCIFLFFSPPLAREGSICMRAFRRP